MWIARDKNGDLCIYNNKPHKNVIPEEWTDGNDWLCIEDKSFSSGKYRINYDDEPKECIIVTLEEYQQMAGELLEYKLKDKPIGEIKEIIMK